MKTKSIKTNDEEIIIIKPKKRTITAQYDIIEAEEVAPEINFIPQSWDVSDELENLEGFREYKKDIDINEI